MIATIHDCNVIATIQGLYVLCDLGQDKLRLEDFDALKKVTVHTILLFS